MSEYELIESKTIVQCFGDDRFVYIEKTKDEITGLNYMQGDDLQYFKAHYCNVDKDLSLFYRAIHVYRVRSLKKVTLGCYTRK